MKQLFKYKVATQCFTYNHKSYIKETLEGFAIQQTDFPVAFIVVDDASTDGEPDFLRAWAETNLRLTDEIAYKKQMPYGELIFGACKTQKNICFAILLLSENHYKNGRGVQKLRYIAEWCNKAEYIAICEGDDYWIDSYKLQKQVEYIDEHVNCSMVCCGTRQYSQRKMLFLDDYRCCSTSQNLNVEDVILKGGGYIPTCSVLYRNIICDDYPPYCINCKVGDWPLQIMAAMKGDVFFLQDLMVVYRTDNINSWTGKNKMLDFQQRLERQRSLVSMLEGFSEDFPKFRSLFLKKIYIDIIREVPIRLIDYRNYRIYINSFSDIIEGMDDSFKKELRKKSSVFYRALNRLLNVFR